MNNQDRIKVIESEISSYNEQGSKRTYELIYRGEIRSLPVIRLDPAFLLLNHNNNRLIAQLDSHSQKRDILQDPFSDESQLALETLLAKTDKFNELKEQLVQLGQREPGLSTRNGLLINGNTRLAAIRQLQKAGKFEAIDVAILPEGTNDRDLLDIEMNLQMTDLVHQDYSFTNELLMMKKYLDSDKSKQELAKQMGWARRGVKKVEQHIRVLNLIEEIRRVAKKVIPYAVFDSKKQHLFDLDDKYQSLSATGNIEEANSLKWTRVSAIFLGINKDQVRAMDEDFLKHEIFEKRLSDDEEADLKLFLESHKPENISNEHDELFDDNAEEMGQAAKAIFANIIDSDDLRNNDGGVKRDITGLVSKLAEGMRLGAESIIQKEKHETMMVAPTAKLKELRLAFEEILHKLPEMITHNDFNNGEFDYELKKAKQSLANMEKQIDRLQAK